MPTIANEKISFEVKFVQLQFYSYGSGCVGMGPSALLFPGARDAVICIVYLLKHLNNNVTVAFYMCRPSLLLFG
jgi:hypothetical protein